MNYKRFYLLLCSLLALLTACHEKELKPADIRLIDPVRHYYPVLQGEMMSVTFEMENRSDHPLFIQEVQTTCGCLVSRDDLPIIVLPHKHGFVHLQFNTIKNSDHFVYCYGNFKDADFVELEFDTNVVPQGDAYRDYEDLWREQAGIKSYGKDFVDGKGHQHGYYTDEGNDPRTRQQQQIQKEVDNLTISAP